QFCFDTCTVGRVCLGEVAQLTFDDFLGNTRHGVGNIAEQTLLFLVVEQAEQIAGLRVVIIIYTVIPVICRLAVQRQRWFAAGSLLPFTLAVGLVVDRAA